MNMATVEKKLRTQFIHIDTAYGPMFADGSRLSSRVLKELRQRRLVAVVQKDLIGKPMQFAKPGLLKKLRTKARRR